MVTSWVNDPKRGVGTWCYNQIGIEYNSEFIDPYGLEVKYNFLGDETDWTNQDPETIITP